MDDIVHLVVQAIRDTNDFLTFPSPMRALVSGLLLSWCITQSVKFSASLVPLSDMEHRVVVRAFSFIAAAIPVIYLWPGAIGLRLLWSAICGSLAPTIYKLATAFLYHRYPWLEAKLSARPSTIP